MPRLVIRKPTGEANDFLLREPQYTLGRATDNDIVLEEPGISRRHALLSRKGDSYTIKDLASHNGTSVNGRRIGEISLNDRDVILIGRHRLCYRSADAADAAEEDAVGEFPPSDTIEQDYELLLSGIAAAREKAAPPGTERNILGMIYELGQALTSTRTVEEAADLALGVVLETTRAERSAIFLPEEDGRTFTPICVRVAEDALVPPGPIPLSSTLARRVMEERKGIITADASYDPRLADGRSVLSLGLRSLVCAPLVGKSGSLGLIYLENNRIAGAFVEDDLKLLCAVASQVGLAIENARFYEALLRSNEDLERQIQERTEDLTRTQLRLYQTEKMASLSRLVAGVAHEINNPLGALKANLELLTVMFGRLATTPERNREEVKLFEHLLGISHSSVSACTRIVGVVRSLCSFARLDESEFKTACVDDCIATVVRLLDPTVRRFARISVDLGGTPPIPCYPALLNEAFMNLLINACQAIRREGTVGVRTFCEGEEVVVTVRDDGCGISPDCREKIFEPGFTTRGVGIGAGLGLAVVYLVIREHGGKIEVESELGKGSAFIVRLPRRGIRTEAGKTAIAG